jgi:hypothetical protein
MSIYPTALARVCLALYPVILLLTVRTAPFNSTIGRSDSTHDGCFWRIHPSGDASAGGGSRP